MWCRGEKNAPTAAAFLPRAAQQNAHINTPTRALSDERRGSRLPLVAAAMSNPHAESMAQSEAGCVCVLECTFLSFQLFLTRPTFVQRHRIHAAAPSNVLAVASTHTHTNIHTQYQPHQHTRHLHRARCKQQPTHPLAKKGEGWSRGSTRTSARPAAATVEIGRASSGQGATEATRVSA